MEKSAGTLIPRYEDFAADGRPLFSALPACLGAVWRAEVMSFPFASRIRDAGIVPILTRVEVELSEDSFSPHRPMHIFGSGEMLRGENRAEDHERVLLDVRARAVAKTGHAILPFKGVSEEREIGRLLGEHALTRLLADKGSRRVSAEDLQRIGVDLPVARPWSPPRSIIEPEEGLTALDSDFVRDPLTTIFGIMHTDANQHVNSLVYPRIFEESVVRRIALLGMPPCVARKVVIGYRKPCFAGETIHIESRLFTRGETTIALGVYLAESDTDRSKARAFVRLEMKN